jgi:hypothetical protein
MASEAMSGASNAVGRTVVDDSIGLFSCCTCFNGAEEADELLMPAALHNGYTTHDA